MTRYIDRISNSLVYLAIMRTREPQPVRELLVTMADGIRRHQGDLPMTMMDTAQVVIAGKGGSMRLIDEVRSILQTPRPQPTITLSIDTELLEAAKADIEDAVRRVVAAFTQSAPDIRAMFAAIPTFTETHTHRQSRRLSRRKRKRRRR